MKVLFLTGAGVSANAGIATYRDGGSSWVVSDLDDQGGDGVECKRYRREADTSHPDPLQQELF